MSAHSNFEFNSTSPPFIKKYSVSNYVLPSFSNGVGKSQFPLETPTNKPIAPSLHSDSIVGTIASTDAPLEGSEPIVDNIPVGQIEQTTALNVQVSDESADNEIGQVAGNSPVGKGSSEEVGQCADGQVNVGEIQSKSCQSKRDFSHITNAEFQSLALDEPAAGTAYGVVSKAGDPKNGSWIAMPAGHINLQCESHRNNYINTCSFSTTKTPFAATKANVAACHMLVLDDVGTKVAKDLLVGTKPTFAIETSPGNYQVGYVFDIPVTDLDSLKPLLDAIEAAGASDPGAIGVIRWVRLPKGINGKDEHKTSDGKPFQCGLVRFNPENRHSVAALTAMFKAMAPVVTSAVITPVIAKATSAEEARKLAELEEILLTLSPDSNYKDWTRVGAACHYETNGSDEGFALFDKWSSGGKTYPGTEKLRRKWVSFGGYTGKPATLGSLVWMKNQSSVASSPVATIGEAKAPTVLKTVPEVPAMPPVAQASVTSGSNTANPLVAFSLREKLHELKAQAIDLVLILGYLVLLGTAAVIYAHPNTGKTLIILYLLIKAIQDGILDPDKVIYINMDDNSNGLIQKVELAHKYGFHMVAGGQQGFQVEHLTGAMNQMIKQDTARNQVLIIDTLKKFTNLMHKDDAREFGNLVRQFVMKGGTVVALAHGNKNLDADGKVVYSGTTDIVEDFDTAYTINTITSAEGSDKKVVEFKNLNP